MTETLEGYKEYLKSNIAAGKKHRLMNGVDESVANVDEMVWQIVIELDTKVNRLERELAEISK